MSASLFLIATEYREAAAQLASLDLDEATVRDTLEAMSGELEVKATSVAHVVRAMEADAAAVKQWAKDATERAKAIEARAERLREYLSSNMQACGIQRVEGPGITLSWRKSHAVVIDDAAQIPAQYMRTPEPPPAAPDKRAIADAMRAGEVVPGARMETRQALQIR
jgi:Siphovirus Gp157